MDLTEGRISRKRNKINKRKKFPSKGKELIIKLEIEKYIYV